MFVCYSAAFCQLCFFTIKDWRLEKETEGKGRREGKRGGGKGRKRKEGREERKREKEKRDGGGTREKCEASGCIR